MSWLILGTLSIWIATTAADCDNADGVHPDEFGAVHCGDEHENEYCNGPGTVYYGYGDHWVTKELASGESVLCSNSAIGCDPLQGTQKDCYMLSTCSDADGVNPVALGAAKCGDEHENEYCIGPGLVFYGYGSHWVTRTLSKGQSVHCSNSALGCDPLQGTQKDCYMLSGLSWLGWQAGTGLGNCEGDCDSDADCQGDLKCYHDGVPPGCSGSAYHSMSDYCYDTDYAAKAAFAEHPQHFNNPPDFLADPEETTWTVALSGKDLAILVLAALNAAAIVALCCVCARSRTHGKGKKYQVVRMVGDSDLEEVGLQ